MDRAKVRMRAVERHIYQRNGVWYYDFVHHGKRYRSSTFERDRDAALGIVDLLMKEMKYKPRLPKPLTKRRAAAQKASGKRCVRERASLDARGYVYIVQCEVTGNVKIGWTSAILKRFRSLQAHSATNIKLRATFAGRRTHERQLHERFAAYRLHGEWFAGTTDLMTALDQLTQDDFKECEAPALPTQSNEGE